MAEKSVRNIEGRVLNETDKAVLIKFKSGREYWIPKSTLKLKFIPDTTDYQIFTIDTWVLKKNKIIVDENFLIRKIVNNVKTHHSDNLIAVYGIGSFFDKNLPDLWIKNDIDLILVIKSLEEIPKNDWNNRYNSEEIAGYKVFFGYNTLEMYQNEQKFKEFSGANYKWALMEIKNPKNSKFLHGKDIRDKLPDFTNLKFDYDDILARRLYHIEKSLRGKDINPMSEFSKAIFKIAFYFCAFFVENYSYTSIIEIGKKIKGLVEVIRSIKGIEMYFEEAVTYRSIGQFKTDFKTLQKEFITLIVSLLESGVLHRKIRKIDLKAYFTKYFGGLPYLIRFLQ